MTNPPLLNAEDLALLRAATGTGTEAFESWQGLSSRIDPIAASPHRLSFLSVIYKNLSRQAGDDPALDLLKGVYRQIWSGNQLMISELVAVAGRLEQAGIEHLITGDTTLAAGYYRDLGARRIRGLELQISQELAGAVDVLGGLGWEVVDGSADGRWAGLISWHPLLGDVGMALRVANYGRLDADDPLRVTLNGRPFTAAGTGEQLLGVCRELGEDRDSLVPQAVDFYTVLTEGSHPIDWNWLFAESARRGCRVALDQLSTLVDTHLGHPVGATVD